MSWILWTFLFIGPSSAMAGTEGPSARVAVLESPGKRIWVDNLQAPVVPVLSMPDAADQKCGIRVVLDGPRVEAVLPGHHCHPVFLAAVQEASAGWSLGAENRRGKPVQETLHVNFELVERDGQIRVDTYVQSEDAVRGSAPPAGLHFTTPVQVLRQRALVRSETLRDAGQSGAIDCRALVEVAADGTFADVSIEHCPAGVTLDMRESLARWTWRPKTVDGSPVASTMVITYQIKAGEAALPGSRPGVGTIRAPSSPEPIGGRAEPAPQGPGAR